MLTHIHTPKLNIYLVANERALILLDLDCIVHALYDTITNILRRDAQPISINLHLQNPTHIVIDCRQAYTDKYPSIFTHPPTTLVYRVIPFRAAWRPKDSIYTNGSQITGNLTLGASIVEPTTHTTTHIEIKSQSERHIINRAELSMITLSLRSKQREPNPLYIDI